MGLDSVINVSIMLVVNVSIMPVSLYGKIVMMSEQQTTLSQGHTISPNYSTVHHSFLPVLNFFAFGIVCHRRLEEIARLSAGYKGYAWIIR